MKLEEFVRSYIENYKIGVLRPSSADRLLVTYRNMIQGTALGNMDMDELRDVDVQNYLVKLSEKYSRGTIKKVRDMLKEVFEYAARMKIVEYNVVRYTRLPAVCAVQEKEVVVLSVEEVGIFCSGWELAEQYYYYPALVLMLNTGMRVAELIALTWSDVDFVSRSIRINKSFSYNSKHIKVLPPKTSKGNRKIPLNVNAMKAVQWYHDYQLGDSRNNDYNLLVYNSAGHYTQYANYKRDLIAVLQELGIEKIVTLHQLRHTFATLLVDSGVAVKTVSELLGHCDTAITNKYYVHPDENVKRTAVDILNDLC